MLKESHYFAQSKKLNNLLSEFTHYSFQTRQPGDNLQSVLKSAFAGSSSAPEATVPRSSCGPEATSFSKMSRHDCWELGSPTKSRQRTENKTYTHIKATKICLLLEFHGICIPRKDGYLYLTHKVKSVVSFSFFSFRGCFQ